MERCMTGSIIPRNSNSSKERGWVINQFIFSIRRLRCQPYHKTCTALAYPRERTLLDDTHGDAIFQQSES